MKYLIFLFSILAVSLFSQKKTPGSVFGVIDGDTYRIETTYKKVEAVYKVRIVNVDAPERYFVAKRRPAQEFADSIYKVVQEKLLGKDVNLIFYGKDNFGRLLAFIELNGERIDQWMLREGLGWAYKEYHPQKGYKSSVALMNKAKSEKKGLWSGSNIVEPSKWRGQ